MGQTAIRSFYDFDDMHISALSEIGNIGSGHAVTALSTMLAQPVNMSIPSVSIVSNNEVYESLGRSDFNMVRIELALSGEMTGSIMLLMPDRVACVLAGTLIGSELDDISQIDELGFSALMELSNIMCASFVNAIVDMTGMNIDISPPTLTTDKLRSIMSQPSGFLPSTNDMTGERFSLYIKNELELSGKTTPANVLLFPDMQSLNNLIAALEISQEWLNYAD